MARPLLCLVSMLKDEAPNVKALLESARPHVDAWCVVDTGSTDGTLNVVRETVTSDWTVPGSLFVIDPVMHRLKRRDRSVFDFGTNRNTALDCARMLGRAADAFTTIGQLPPPDPAVFTLFLSGHETLHVEGDALRLFLEAHRDAPEGAYCVQMRSGTRGWPYTRVLRVDGGWRYDGVIHECPIGPNGENKGPIIPGVVIVHAPTDAERKMRRIVEHDLPTLEDTVEDESLTLEQRAGSMIFLAETHALIARDIKERGQGTIPPGGPWLTHQMAAMSLYLRYAEIGEQPNRPGYDPHKVQYALALFYSLAGEMPWLYTHAEMAARLARLVQAAPKLPEAHFLLAKHAAQIDPKRGPKLGLFHALEAARVAREARKSPTYEVTETSIEWRSLLLASACADRLHQDAPSAEERLRKGTQAKKLLEAAIAAGAPQERIEEAATGETA